MTKKVYVNICLLLAPIAINEMYLWFMPASTASIDLFYALDYSLPVPWVVKFLTGYISNLLIAILIYRLANSKYLKAAALAYVWLCVSDIVLFFWDFNQGNKFCVYILVFLFVYYKCFYNGSKTKGHRPS
ncbi:MAG TPA: hypothetical protein VD794_05440 [Flavisolibacter sp.]|nr:hypothetical protein [Flavisolibacter sp.]